MKFKNFIKKTGKIIWPYLIPTILVIPLIFIKCGETEVRIEVLLNDLTFDIECPVENLFSHPEVDEVSIIGFDTISVPFFRNDSIAYSGKSCHLFRFKPATL